jgi:hypothetical protein
MIVNEIEYNISKLNIGDIFYVKNGPQIYKKHIVAILKKENEPQIIYKWYGKVKQYWHYEIESVYSFNYAFNIGLYKLNRKELNK